MALLIRSLLLQDLRTAVSHRFMSSSAPAAPSVSGERPEAASSDQDIAEGGDEAVPSSRRIRNYWKMKQQRYHKHISDLVRKSRQAEAVKLLEQMEKGRVRPDQVTYNTILSGYAKQKDIKMAFRIFNRVCLSMVGNGNVVST